MKIPYQKKRDYLSLVVAISWGLYALGMLSDGEHNWKDYVSILSVIYFLNFFFEKRTYYLRFKEGVVTTRKFFGKKIHTSEIKEAIKTNNNYILKTGITEIMIDAKVIDEDSLKNLNTKLKELNLEWS